MPQPELDNKIKRNYSNMPVWNPTQTLSYRLRTMFSPHNLVAIDWLKVGGFFKTAGLGMFALWSLQEYHTEEAIHRTQMK